MWVSHAAFQSSVQGSCSAPQALQQVNLSAGHPNQLSPEGAQLEDNSQCQTQIIGDKEDALPATSFRAGSLPSIFISHLGQDQAPRLQ